MRLKQGVSQELLALRAEVDRSYMGRVERGDNNLSLLTLVKICAALGVSASEVLRDADL